MSIIYWGVNINYSPEGIRAEAPISILQKPTKILSDVYLWKRPIDTREKVFGHVIFKKL